MANEPIDTPAVDPNTDDLDAFTDLFTGKAKEKIEETVEPDEVEPVSEDDDTEVEDQATEDEAPDGDDDSEEKPVEKPKKVNRVQERINELTARAREAERALEALRAAQAPKQDEPAPQAPSAPVAGPAGPDPDALNADGTEKYPLGQFDPDYIRDMARHTIETEWARKEQEAAANNQRQQVEQARAEIQNGWVEKLQPALEQHEDFLDKTMELESAFDGLDPQYSDYLVQTIKSLDHGPEVLYYFANNIEEAQKFVKLGPLNATLALGEINAMFKGQTRKAEPKVSKAPPPPQVNKGTKTRTTIAADTDDLDDFEKIFFKRK
jgi:hypothetical protein